MLNGAKITDNGENASVLSVQYSSVFSTDKNLMPEIPAYETESKIERFSVLVAEPDIWNVKVWDSAF